MNFTIYILHL